MIASLTPIGANAQVIWEFCAALLAVFLLAAVLILGVEAIKRFLDL